MIRNSVVLYASSDVAMKPIMTALSRSSFKSVRYPEAVGSASWPPSTPTIVLTTVAGAEFGVILETMAAAGQHVRAIVDSGTGDAPRLLRSIADLMSLPDPQIGSRVEWRGLLVKLAPVIPTGAEAGASTAPIVQVEPTVPMAVEGVTPALGHELSDSASIALGASQSSTQAAASSIQSGTDAHDVIAHAPDPLNTPNNPGPAMTDNPGPAGAVENFVDPKTGDTIYVLPQEGESAQDAIQRVRTKHGL